MFMKFGGRYLNRALVSVVELYTGPYDAVGVRLTCAGGAIETVSTDTAAEAEAMIQEIITGSYCEV